MDAGNAEHMPLELDQLSAREREVLGAALVGLSAPEIADRLSITEATVRSHLSSIYGKLGVRGRVELLARVNAAPEDLTSQPPATPGRPRGTRHHGLRSRLVAAVVAVGVVVAGCLVFALWRPDLPPRTNLATVAQLLAERQVARLDLYNTDLTVTKTDGQRLLVQHVSLDAWRSLGAAKLAYPGSGLGFTAQTGGPTPLDDALLAASAIVPIVLAAGAIVLILRALRRRGPPLRLAG